MKPRTLSPELQRIAYLAAVNKKMVFTTLAHHITVDMLRHAYELTRKDGAPGVDGETWKTYGDNLESNLKDLHERLKSRRYVATPVRRAYIPKEDGTARPIGIAAFEDKIVQRAASIILSLILEQDFYDFSYGFREGRSAHAALRRLRKQLVEMGIGYIVDADISGLFDNLDWGVLRELMHRRVKDGGIDRLIGKWLNAGALDGEELSYPEKGTPQGSVISPLLANIYLHYVLDEWFVEAVQPRLKGKAFLIRYADDFIMGFELEEDAKRVLEVLPRRMAKYGLSIHPEKTRLVPFIRPQRGAKEDETNGTFDFLGFTHYWAKSLRGYWVVKRSTARKRLNRAKKAIDRWCRINRHVPVVEQHSKLAQKLRGHYQYYGLRCNYRSLSSLYHYTVRTWHKWLSRRSQRARIAWEKFREIIKRFPLPLPRIIHQNI